jgi:aminoglycoside 6'-N-acetyltransferase I
VTTRYGLEIRAATSAEAPGLAELLGLAGYPIEPRVLAERLDEHRQWPGAALIALEWGPPSGLVVLHWYRTLAAAQPAAQITALFVSPDNRRRGIGRLLLKAASQAARLAGCDALELTAGGEEPTLSAVCLATGFSEVGSRYVRALRKKG